METIPYKGWAHCIRLANSSVEMIITGDVGPRIIHFGFIGEPNEFYEDKAWSGKSGDAEFHAYGGHRLWRAPEDMKLTYVPDNRPVKVDSILHGVHLTPPPETPAGIQKEWFVQLDPAQAHACVKHRLTNINSHPLTLAPWALSVMAPGGTAILPLPPRGSHPDNLLPSSRMILWAYTDLSDSRWGLGKKYIRLHQDPKTAEPQKIGASVPDGWAAHCRNGHLFLKTFSYEPEKEYPDLGSSTELFTNGDILEVETLGPLLTLSPGQSVDHTEEWFLFDHVPSPAGDPDVERTILPKLESAKRMTLPRG